jgi:hypothetical protein
MKSILQSLQNQPCRIHEISENEKNTFSDYEHLQRYYPALDFFKIPETATSHKYVELPSKYIIDSWIGHDPKNNKIWKAKRICEGKDMPEECDVFVKSIHLLNPIDMLKEKYVCPEHPLLPQSESVWKKTLLKLHSHNNQAYVDTVCNFILSRFRELDLTPHCNLYYGSITGISKNYQFKISNEYDSYRQCKWFWKGMKSHSAKLTVVNNDPDISEIPDFEEIYKEIVTSPFEDSDTDSETSKAELEPIEDNADNLSEIESIKSINFDNIEENAENVVDIFELNKKVTKRHSVKNKEVESSDESSNSSNDDSDSDSDDEDSSDDSIELDLDIIMEIPNMPVICIYQEAQEGVMDTLLDKDEIDGHERGSKEWEARWIAWLFQVVAALTFLQSAICFTHNDLHSNNILWRKTDKKYLYYKTNDGTVWKIPTYGRIFSIIDFGRAIFRLGKHLWVSDDHWPDQEAGDQYNFGPFFDHTKPKVPPNPSFDLCRLAVSLIDGLFDERPAKRKGKYVPVMSQEGSWKVFETVSPLYNLLWSWTVDKNKETIYEDKDGNEKYEGFDLYIRIAQDVEGSVPKQQIYKPIFQDFKWKQKIAYNATNKSLGIPEDETIYSLGI